MIDNLDYFIGIIHENSCLLVTALIYTKHYIKHITLAEYVFVSRKAIEKMMIRNCRRDTNSIPYKLPFPGASLQYCSKHNKIFSLLYYPVIFS